MTGLRCPNCGFYNLSARTKCARCGKPLPDITEQPQSQNLFEEKPDEASASDSMPAGRAGFPAPVPPASSPGCARGSGIAAPRRKPGPATGSGSMPKMSPPAIRRRPKVRNRFIHRFGFHAQNFSAAESAGSQRRARRNHWFRNHAQGVIGKRLHDHRGSG